LVSANHYSISDYKTTSCYKQIEIRELVMTMMHVMTPATHEVVNVDVDNEFLLDLITPNGGLVKEAGSLIVAASDVTPRSLDTLFGEYEVDKSETEALRTREKDLSQAAAAVAMYNL
jgi:hypothetical protein